MNQILIGLVGSIFCVFFFMILFTYESRRGTRFAESLRVRADFYVLQCGKFFRHSFQYIGGGLARQIMHYLFHSFLRSILDVVKRIEQGLRNVMRINKTLAKRAERESDTRNKLEEIAIHKATHALTEDEKRIRKAKMLHGHPHS